jgi:hypothetical protein
MLFLRYLGYFLLMNLITLAACFLLMLLKDLIEARPSSLRFPMKMGTISLFISNLSYILGLGLEYLSARWFKEKFRGVNDPFRYARMSLFLVAIVFFTGTLMYFLA